MTQFIRPGSQVSPCIEVSGEELVGDLNTIDSGKNGVYTYLMGEESEVNDWMNTLKYISNTLCI